MSSIVKDRNAGPLASLGLARYKDIVLSGRTAFHARTMEIAELSQEMTDLMTPITLREDFGPNILAASSSNEAIEGLRQEVLQELNAWSEGDLEPDLSKTITSPDLRSVTINATQICNLHCTYCAAGGDGTYSSPQKQIDLLKSVPELKRVLESKKTGSVLHVSFLGGEPLLFPKGIRVLCEFLKTYADEHGIQLTFKVTTNGTVMNATIIRLLEDFKMGIVISCDGTPNIQDQYRPSKSSISSSAMLEKAVGELMQQRANIPFIGVHCVYHTKEQSMTRSVDYFKSLGFDWYEFTPDVSNSSEELTEAYLQSLAELALREFELGGISALCRIQNLNMVFSRLETQTPLRNHCGIGKSFMMMDAQGDFYLCPWMIGSASAKISTLQDESTAIFKNDLIDLHDCQSCWARNLCGGGCHFIHSKSKEKKDKSYCERVRGTMALAIHYFGQFQTQQ